MADSNGLMKEYMPCASLDTVCLVNLPDLLSGYLLVEGDLIKVEVTATNVYGTSPPSELGQSV